MGTGTCIIFTNIIFLIHDNAHNAQKIMQRKGTNLMQLLQFKFIINCPMRMAQN